MDYLYNLVDYKLFIIVTVIVILILVLKDFIMKYRHYLKNKDSKFKYLPCIAKSTEHWSVYILPLIFIIYYIIHDIKIWGLDDVFYINILCLIILGACNLIVEISWRIISGNRILINDKFIVLYSGRINFEQINCVEIFPIKRLFRRRKIDIYVNGKLHTRFFIRNKYTSEIINIFKDKCKNGGVYNEYK